MKVCYALYDVATEAVISVEAELGSRAGLGSLDLSNESSGVETRRKTNPVTRRQFPEEQYLLQHRCEHHKFRGSIIIF